MKKLYLFIGLFLGGFGMWMKGTPITQDTSFDALYYNLNLTVEVDSPWVHGNVTTRFASRAAGLTRILLDLTDSLTVDSITGDASAFQHRNDSLIIDLSGSLNPGDIGEVTVHYHGRPPRAGGIKGLRYETHNSGEPIIVSLSTPFLAHTWWPCKDGPGDKPDSVAINISIPDRMVAGIPLTVVSNGTLDSTSTAGGYKTFHWTERYPIPPYYVMAGISNYINHTESYTDPLGNTYPLEYYFFREDSAPSVNGIQQIPDVMSFFTNIFGPYPFRNEKYGMCQLGFYSGIENQTMTIINSMESSWMMTSVHEAAHMWFADNITCEHWGHGWLNEGFATYSEALWLENQQGINAYHNEMLSTQYLGGDTLFLNPTDDPFGIFVGVIYYKGAWVLHMLRHVLGDSVFFDAIKTYATDPNFQLGYATTEQFRDVCEAVSGTDLDYFFDQWVYKPWNPAYQYWYSQNSQTNEVTVNLEQLQVSLGRPLFTMPVDVRLYYAGGGDTTIVVWNDSASQRYTLPAAGPVSQVAIDPDRWILRNVTLTTAAEQPEDYPVNEFKVFPNPASGFVTVELLLSEDTKVKVEVFDMKGNKIKVIRKGKIGSGNKKMYWRGTDEHGNNVPNGAYLIRVEAENWAEAKQLIWTVN